MTFEDRINNIIKSTCWALVRTFPKRVNLIHINEEPYLLRFHIKHCGRLPGIYLHRFYKGDDDRALHNHPWRKAYSFILTGGYNEEVREEDDTVRTIPRLPGMFNVLSGDTFHRVQLREGPGWTLFCSIDKIQDWGFWDRDTGKYTPHAEYLEGREESYVTDLDGNIVELAE